MKDLVDNLSEEDLANIPIIKLDANNEPKPAKIKGVVLTRVSDNP